MPDFLGSWLSCTGRPPHQGYTDRADYEARVRDAAGRRVDARFLLPDDVDLVVHSALSSYDESVSGR